MMMMNRFLCELWVSGWVLALTWTAIYSDHGYSDRWKAVLYIYCTYALAISLHQCLALLSSIKSWCLFTLDIIPKLMNAIWLQKTDDIVCPPVQIRSSWSTIFTCCQYIRTLAGTQIQVISRQIACIHAMIILHLFLFLSPMTFSWRGWRTCNAVSLFGSSYSGAWPIQTNRTRSSMSISGIYTVQTEYVP